MTEKTFEGGFGAYLDVFGSVRGQRPSERISAFFRQHGYSDLLLAEIARTGRTEEQVLQHDLMAVMTERLLQTDPLFYSRVNTDFFTRLEAAGSVTLTAQQRGAFVAAIAHAPDPCNPSRFIATHRKRETLCIELLGQLEERPIAGIDFLRLRNDLKTLALECRSRIAELEPKAGKRGRVKAIAPETILRGMFVVFALAKGDFAVKDLNDGYFAGPFVDFLKVAWEAIPTCHRPTSPEEFVRKAVRLNRKWKKAGGGFP